MPKNHGRDFFFKYTSFNTAKIILRDLTYRWSSPLLFNDPFDTQMELRNGFIAKNSELLYWEEIQRRTLMSLEPLGSSNNPLFRIIMAIRGGEVENIFPEIIDSLQKGEVRALTTPMNQLFENVQSNFQGLNDDWKTLLNHMRIFSVSEVLDDLLMWAHYAENHTGVVFKLSCLPEKDNALCIAQQVNYSNDIPIMVTIEDLVNHQCGVGKFTELDYFKKQALTKSYHWNYEKEWRIVDFRPDQIDQLYVDVPFHPEEINSLFLGCRMSSGNREQIKNMAKAVLPHVKLFQASVHKSKFQLNFEEVE
ncbi:DUF2971 domain-containing protein [Nitrospira sp. MA-1]|nr:DUF2971 domain-containing protein [Nitrospira sp. MA-1]